MIKYILQEDNGKLLQENNFFLLLNFPKKMLTTLQKVKNALGITNNTYDTLLTDYIAQVTAFIQSACGGRIFESADYVEVKDYPDGENIFLKNYPITEVQELAYRTGTISTPIWVPYSADDFLIYDGEGYLKIVSQFGGNKWQPTGEYQMLQVKYTGGYLIDWANEYDPTLHTLPADLTGLATSIVCDLYTTSGSSSGVKSESTEGQSITYTDISAYSLSDSQKIITSRYTRYSI